jgi:hypothetical protein
MPRNGQRISPEEVLRVIGDPKVVEAEMQQFDRSVALLASNLAEHYAGRWVAIYDGSIKASAVTLKGLRSAMDEQHLPRGRTLVHFVDENPPKHIL